MNRITYKVYFFIISSMLLNNLSKDKQLNAQEINIHSVDDSISAPHSSRPFHIGLIYPLSTNGVQAGNISTNISLHAILGINNGTNALDIAGIGSINIGNQKGVTASGVVNYIKGSANGLLIAGVTNINKDAIKGAQLSGVLNVADSVKGVQLTGIANIATACDLQIAGTTNIAKESDCQISGIVSIAKKNKFQLSGFAGVTDYSNVQISGFMNIAKKNKGLQLAGFLNIGSDVKYPIGIINLIKNGRKSLGLSIDEVGNTIMSFKSGGAKTYGVLGVGKNFFLDHAPNVLEVGWGFHNQLNNFWSLQYEIVNTANTDFVKASYYKSSFRILLGLYLKNIYIFAGPSINYINNMQGLETYSNLQIVNFLGTNSVNTFTYGGVGGVAIKL